MQLHQSTQFKKILDEKDVHETLVELSHRQNPEELRRKYLDAVSYIDSKSNDKAGLALLMRTQALVREEFEKDRSRMLNDILIDVNHALARASKADELRQIEEAKNIGFGI